MLRWIRLRIEDASYFASREVLPHDQFTFTDRVFLNSARGNCVMPCISVPKQFGANGSRNLEESSQPLLQVIFSFW